VDESGKTQYEVVRLHGKQFRQRRRNPDGSYSWGLGGVDPLPFRADKLKSADVVFVVEGERDALTMERLGLVATCNSGGAGKFKPELVPHFTGKHVAVLGDNDEPGRAHQLKVAALLAPVAKSLKIVELPDLPVKGDVTDYINAGGTVEQIRELYRKAQPWTPGWEFATNVPDENDKHVRTIEQEVEAAGGLTEFWNLAKFTGLPTPFTKLNWVLDGGMRPGEVYVIGGNQGSGKTSLALQFALSALPKGFRVLIFSMEMNHRAVYQRMAGIDAHVDLHEFRIKQIHKADTADEIFRLSRATAAIAGWKLQVSTKPSVTPEYLISETKRLAKRTNIDLVIVDHMQLMGAEGTTRGDYEKFTAISRAVKQTAMELNIPLILVSQTSRFNTRERRAELEVSDLRGSGAIEEDAAGVFLLFEDSEDAKAAMTEARDEKTTRYMAGPVKTWLKIGKNRYGIQGAYLALKHYKNQTRFEAQESEERESE
jgi:KaiC/GvpD/RAD55 family RecA-like ATPase